MAEKNSDNSSEKRQYISIFICWLAYVSVYFARYTYSANLSMLKEHYNVSNASAGLVMTFFSVAYGCGQLIHGIFCKYYPKRTAISFVLIASAVMDILLFLDIPFFLIKYVWLIGAVLQSVLWPTLMQIISENVSAKLMKKAIIVMSTTTSAGLLLVYGISAFFSEFFSYKCTFIFGAIEITAAAVIWFVLYKPGGYIRMKIKNSGKKSADKKIEYAVLLPIVLLGIFAAVTNFAKDGLQNWVTVILKEIHGMSDSTSIILSLVLPVFGIFGALSSTFLNKYIKTLIWLAIFFLGFSAMFNFIAYRFQNNLSAMVFSFGMLELLLHGSANVIVSIFPLSMREKISTGFLAGLLNACSYLGSSASNYVLGKVADVTGGWNAVFLTLLGALAATLVFGFVYMLFAVKHKEIKV